MKKLALMILICIFIASCTSVSHRVATNTPSGSCQEIGQNEGSACGFILFGIIPIAYSDVPERAYKDAIDDPVIGDALINPSVSESWYNCGVGMLLCTHVSGTVVKMK